MKNRSITSEVQEQELTARNLPAGWAHDERLCISFAGQEVVEPVNGDQRVITFIEAAERYRTRLLSVARRIAPPQVDPEDVVQDALLKGFRKLSQFRNESRMETWLYKITQNSARECMRRQKGLTDISIENGRDEGDGAVTWDIPDLSKDPEEQCLYREMQEILAKEIQGLAPKCRQAFMLCIFDEIPQRAVARRLKIEISTVKSRLFKGKQHLKRTIRLHHGVKGCTEECLQA